MYEIEVELLQDLLDLFKGSIGNKEHFIDVNSFNIYLIINLRFFYQIHSYNYFTLSKNRRISS